MCEKIFISYHRKDSSKASDLQEILIDHNYSVVMIDEDYDFDGEYHDHIAQICVDEITPCDVVICLVGTETYSRAHVDHELKKAFKGGIGNRKGVIAVMLEERGDSKNNIDYSTFPNRLQDNQTEQHDYIIIEQFGSFYERVNDAIDDAIDISVDERSNPKNNRYLMELRKGKYYDQYGNNDFQ